MADNYLEKRMEEYRSGRLASRNRTSASMRTPRKDNQLVFTYPPMSVVMITDRVDEVFAAAVGAFTAVGCRVAFTSGNPVASNRLAQRCGARFYPHNVLVEDLFKDVTSRWGDVDIVLPFISDCRLSRALTGMARVIDVGEIARVLLARGAGDAAVGRHLLYLSHPDNSFLLDSYVDFV